MSPSVRKWPIALMLLALSPAFLRCARSTSANALTAPSVTSVAPNVGPLAGATSITITGAAFTLTSTVAIGGKLCTDVVPITSTQITCTTPANSAGAADVVVTNRNFTTGELASGTLTGGFTYQPAPTVTSSTQGFYMGGTTVTITGTGFRSGATVTIGGSACTSPNVVSATSLTCVNPAGTANATGTIVVTNTDSQTGTLTNGFTWRLPQYNTFLDGNGTQGLGKDTTQNASKPILVDAGSRLAAVWQEIVSGGTSQIRAVSFDGTLSGTTAKNWTFFDGNNATGLNKDTTKAATDPNPAVLSSKVYVTWSEANATNKQIRVAVNTGTLTAGSWTFVEKAVPDANGLNINTALDANEPRAFVFNSKLYVGWREFDSLVDQVRVKEYNGNDGAPAWTTRSPATGLNFNTSFGAGRPTLGTVSSKLYAMWSESDGTNTIMRMKVWSGAGTAWSNTNTSAGFGCNCNQATARDTAAPMLLQFNSKLYATWTESNGTNTQVRVAVYNGNDAGPSFTCVDGGGATGTLNKSSSNNASNPRLGILGGTLYATWTEGATGQTRVAAYNGNDSSPSWTFVDGNLSTGMNKDNTKAASAGDILGYGNYIYSAWSETDGVSTSIRVKYGN